MRMNGLAAGASVIVLLLCSACVLTTMDSADAADAGIDGLSYSSEEGLTLKVSADSSYRIRILDVDGRQVWAGNVEVSSSTGTVAVSDGKIIAGKTYSVVLCDYNTVEELDRKSFTACTLSISPGSGSGTMTDIVVSKGYSYVLPSADDLGFTAPSGSSFKAWYVGSREYQPGSSVEISGDTTVTALWTSEAKTAIVTWKNYDGTVLQSGQVAYGTVPTYNGSTPMRPQDEKCTYTFSGWDNAPAAVTEDAVYTACFTSEPRAYAVTATASPASGGSVILSVDGETIASGAKIAYGTEVVLTIVQNEGYKLTGLRDNGSLVPLETTYIFTVDGQRDLEAVFAETSEIPYRIEVSCGEGGSVSPFGTDGVVTLYGGQSQTFTIRADCTHKIGYVTIDGVAQELTGKAIMNITISDIGSDHSISVGFEDASYVQVAVDCGSGGKADVSGTDAQGRAYEGRTITVAVSPDSGYRIKSVAVNGTDITGNGAGTDPREYSIDVDDHLASGRISISIVFEPDQGGDHDSGGNSSMTSMAIIAVVCIAVIAVALYVVARNR